MLSETLIRRQAKRRRGQTRADAQEGFDLPDSLPLLRSNPPRHQPVPYTQVKDSYRLNQINYVDRNQLVGKLRLPSRTA